MDIKQGLELKQTQKLSPLQIQTIKLIELPIQELEQRIRAELEENPVLDDTPDPESDREEDRKDVSLDEIKDQEDNIKPYNLKVNNWGKDARPEYNTFSVRESFTQSLMNQLPAAGKGRENSQQSKKDEEKYSFVHDEGGVLHHRFPG